MGKTLLIDLSGFAALLMAAAFFAGSETALTAASRARMHSLESEGNKRARLVNRLRDKKDSLIGALLLGNTLVAVLMGSLTTAATIELIGEKYVLVAAFITSAFMIVFAEVMPKTFALRHPDNVSLFVAPIVSIVMTLLSPAVHAIAKIVQWIFHVFGADKSGYSAEAQEQELRGAIELLGEEQGDDKEGQERKAMLHSVLDLANVQVEKVMIHRKNVLTINADLPVAQIVDEVLNSAFTRMPVWKESPDNIIGIIHAKLLLQELRHCEGNVSRLDINRTMMEPWFVPESTTLFDQLQAFRKRQEHFALVVDEYGALMGVVTLEDILEEIVGQIDDEHDMAVSGIRSQNDGSFIVDGKVTIRDLNRALDWNLPDQEEYSTVAGLLLFESQRVPIVGQSFTFHDFRFDILKKQRNQITSIRMTPLKTAKREEKKAS